MNAIAAHSLHFSPLLPPDILLGMSVLAVILAGMSLLWLRRGVVGRGTVAALFLLVLWNPSILEQQRESVRDTAVILIDRSASQSISERPDMIQQAENMLSLKSAGMEGIDIRTIEIGGTRETRIFDALDQALADVPMARRAGVVIITDGQVHDVPDTAERRKSYGPVHVLLTGERNEQDRQMLVTEAPAYGIVGQDITVRYTVRDDPAAQQGRIGDKTASVILRDAAGGNRVFRVPVNQEQSLTLNITHAGQNVFELEAAPLDGEITTINNRVPLLVNGVRDRLKVLLVSGLPHPGERTWRDLLTSDPGVDLVHFTILREPHKVDMTPQDELSLIAFPFRELFEVKLYEFDLIIFDRYTLNRVLPNYYFNNIAAYVRKGGALLEASGPSFAGEDSVYTTALGDILPAAPGGGVMEAAYKPTLTDLGLRHPVTQNLNHRDWGPWLRQVPVRPKSGDIVMNGLNGQPLLILDRVGEGRVAQLASDQIWLWSRGFMGGGPQADLLRRLAHWLMKEPELEENALELSSDGDHILIRRRDLHSPGDTVTLTRPDGNSETVTLTASGGNAAQDGWLEASIPAGMDGVYQAQDGTHKRFAVIGEVNPPEWRGVITTDEHLKTISAESGGRVVWTRHEGIPDLRRVSAGNRNFGGFGWIALRDNRAFAVTGVRDIPLIPALAGLLALLLLAVAAWWFEGHSGFDRRRRAR